MSKPNIDHKAGITRALIALRRLYDEQNGAPLIRREIEWAGAMNAAREVLADYERLLPGDDASQPESEPAPVVGVPADPYEFTKRPSYSPVPPEQLDRYFQEVTEKLIPTIEQTLRDKARGCPLCKGADHGALPCPRLKARSEAQEFRELKRALRPPFTLSTRCKTACPESLRPCWCFPEQSAAPRHEAGQGEGNG